MPDMPLEKPFLQSKKKDSSKMELLKYSRTRVPKKVLSLPHDFVDNEPGEKNVHQGENLVVFSRKKRNLLDGSQHLESEKKGPQKDKQEGTNPSTPEVVVIEEKGFSGRSKRPRKNNNRKDFFLWSSFGRIGAKKSHPSKKCSPKDIENLKENTDEESEHEAYVQKVPDALSIGDSDSAKDGIKEHSLETDVDGLSDHEASLVANDPGCQRVLDESSGCRESSLEDNHLHEEKKTEFSLKEKVCPEKKRSLSPPRNTVICKDDCHEKPRAVIDATEKSESSSTKNKEVRDNEKHMDMRMLDSPSSTNTNEASETFFPEDVCREEMEQMSFLQIPNGKINILENKMLNVDYELTTEKDLQPSHPVPAEDAVIFEEGTESCELRNEGSKLAHQDDSITDCNSFCQSCGLSGILIWCDWKESKARDHSAGHDPPFKEALNGDWYCFDCAREKNNTKLNAVSMVIDSIWDVKSAIYEDETHGTSCIDKIETTIEAVQSNQEEAISSHLEKGSFDADKIYFVKYKQASHIHNQWVPESQLVKEAPKLLSSFQRKAELGMAPKWNPNWVQACRIIGKRSMERTDVSNFNDTLEWFVKWKSLGYEQCTWERSDLAALTSSTSLKLIKDFEERCQAAEKREKAGKHQSTCVLRSEIQEVEVQPDWMEGGKLSFRQLDALNMIRKLWKMRLNAMIVDNSSQERTIRSILFLLTLFKEVESTNPVLVVTSVSTISLWENTFSQWAPTMNVVTYMGTKEARQVMQSYEIINDNGHLMVDILLTSYDTLNLDLDYLKEIHWEAFVIDECQRLKSTKALQTFQSIVSDYTLLLLNEPLKDNVDEYSQILSILESDNHEFSESQRHSQVHEESDLMDLKGRLSSHIVYEENGGINTHFMEFWVPVEMSNVQVEEYCKLLIENLSTLNAISNEIVDAVDVSKGLLLKLRECCNHPYLVNPSLQGHLENPSAKELLELGIKLCGKLQFLDSLLVELKSVGRKVVIITQMHLRSEKDKLMMHILDDYMRQRFGEKSYERADAGLAMQKKQAAVQRFNARGSDCFVFLLDKRACGPAIKLNSVDLVIFFDSDWSLQADIHALQRVRFDCQPKDLRIFRLYTPRSLEERALIFARLGSELDSNSRSFNMGVCQKLLRWGAHENLRCSGLLENDSNYNVVDKISYTREELRILLGQSLGVDHSFPTGAFEWRVAGRYSDSAPLYTENKANMKEDQELSAEFWPDLFKDWQPLLYQDAPGRELRIRKKVQYCEDSLVLIRPAVDMASEEDDEVRRKRRKLLDGQDISKSQDSLTEKSTAYETYPDESKNPEESTNKGTSTSNKEDNPNSFNASDSGVNLGRSEKQQILQSMKADLLKLCRAFKLQDDVSKLAEQLLSFFISKYKIPMNSKPLLYAMELSMCWIAAEQRHYCIDHSATLAMAESCFGAELTQVDSVYAKMVTQWDKNSGVLNQNPAQAQGGGMKQSEGNSLSQQSVEADNSDLNPMQRPAIAEQPSPGPPSICQEHSTDPSCTKESAMDETPLQVVLGLASPQHSNDGPHNQSLQCTETVTRALLPESLKSLRNRLLDQKAERMRTLLEKQKVEVGKVDYWKKTFFTEHVRKYQTKPHTSLLQKSLQLLEDLFHEKKQRLIRKQFAERDKENKLFALELEKLQAGGLISDLLPVLDARFELSEYVPQSTELSAVMELLGHMNRPEFLHMIGPRQSSPVDSTSLEIPGRTQSGVFQCQVTNSSDRPAGANGRGSHAPSPLPHSSGSRTGDLGSLQLQRIPNSTSSRGLDTNSRINTQDSRSSPRFATPPTVPLSSSAIPESRFTNNANASNSPIVEPPVAIEGTSGTTIPQVISAPSRPAQQHYNDPLVHELARIKREKEKAKSVFDAEKDRIRSQYVKEFEALKRKYEDLAQKENLAFVKKCEMLEAFERKVELNRRLAEVFRIKPADNAGTFYQGASTQDANSLNSMPPQLESASVNNARTLSPTLPGLSATHGVSMRGSSRVTPVSISTTSAAGQQQPVSTERRPTAGFVMTLPASLGQSNSANTNLIPACMRPLPATSFQQSTVVNANSMSGHIRPPAQTGFQHSISFNTNSTPGHTGPSAATGFQRSTIVNTNSVSGHMRSPATNGFQSTSVNTNSIPGHMRSFEATGFQQSTIANVNSMPSQMRPPSQTGFQQNTTINFNSVPIHIRSPVATESQPITSVSANSMPGHMRPPSRTGLQQNTTINFNSVLGHMRPLAATGSEQRTSVNTNSNPGQMRPPPQTGLQQSTSANSNSNPGRIRNPTRGSSFQSVVLQERLVHGQSPVSELPQRLGLNPFSSIPSQLRPPTNLLREVLHNTETANRVRLIQNVGVPQVSSSSSSASPSNPLRTEMHESRHNRTPVFEEQRGIRNGKTNQGPLSRSQQKEVLGMSSSDPTFRENSQADAGLICLSDDD